MKLIPSIKKQIDDEMEKICDSLEKEVKDRTKHLNYITVLPNKGLSKDEILSIVNKNVKFGNL